MTNDKDWLAKVSLAYKVYGKQSDLVQEFIEWLYKQYGIKIPSQ